MSGDGPVLLDLDMAHSLDLEQARTLATQRLYELPTFANSLSRWELHLPAADHRRWPAALQAAATGAYSVNALRNVWGQRSPWPGQLNR